MRRVQLWILNAALVSYVLFAQLGFSLPTSVYAWACIAVAVVALVGTLRNRRWTRIPVTAVAILVIAEFTLSVYYSLKIDYFSHLSPGQLLRALGPGILACLLAVDCCFVAFFYVGKPEASPRTG